VKFSRLVERIQGRRTTAWDIHRTAQQAAARGEDVIVLSVGDPDFATPDVITHEFTWELFRAQKVSVLDAGAFGETAAGYVRLGLVVDEARLLEACDRIAGFVRQRAG